MLIEKRTHCAPPIRKNLFVIFISFYLYHTNRETVSIKLPRHLAILFNEPPRLEACWNGSS